LEFSFEIMVCSQDAKAAAYETARYLFILLEKKPSYKRRTPILYNLMTLFSLMLPQLPWVGLPTSHHFGITWHTVRKLLAGATGIACLKVKEPEFNLQN